MRKYLTEDRSEYGFDIEEPKTRKENQTLQDMEHLTDFTAEEFDSLANMYVGQVKILWNWLYIKRTE